MFNYLLAKIGFDTAENGLLKVFQKLAKINVRKHIYRYRKNNPTGRGNVAVRMVAAR